MTLAARPAVAVLNWAAGRSERRLTHQDESTRLLLMSKRLQVLLEEPELREIQRLARRERMTVAEWVRQTLRAARRREPLKDTGRKLEVVRAAARHAYPVGSIEEILAQIERGYVEEGPR